MKATITVEDADDGEVKVKLEFDPAVGRDTPMTAAAQLGLRVMKALPKLSRGEDE